MLTLPEQQALRFTGTAAVVMNMHITGLAVTRSLSRSGVEVLGLDKEHGGLGQHSRHLHGMGLVPGPEDDEALRDHLLALAPTFPTPPVLFACNDDWVLALSRHRAALEPHYLFSWAAYDVVKRTLSKTDLYQACEAHGIAIPRSWYLDRTALEDLEYPCVLKPDDSRGFYNAFGAKVFVVHSVAEAEKGVAAATEHELSLVAQEWVDTPPGGFWSVCSYLTADGIAKGVFTGRKLEQWPPDFGTSCLADAQWEPGIARAGITALRALGYHGISEIEFVLDARSGQHLLLDANTRPWKWIGLPIAAGVDLPLLAYRDAIGDPVSSHRQRDGARWVFLRDYLPLVRARAATVPEAAVTKHEWTALLAGEPSDLVDGVHDREDPEPSYDLLWSELSGGAGYSCAC